MAETTPLPFEICLTFQPGANSVQKSVGRNVNLFARAHVGRACKRMMRRGEAGRGDEKRE